MRTSAYHSNFAVGPSTKTTQHPKEATELKAPTDRESKLSSRWSGLCPTINVNTMALKTRRSSSPKITKNNSALKERDGAEGADKPTQFRLYNVFSTRLLNLKSSAAITNADSLAAELSVVYLDHDLYVLILRVHVLALVWVQHRLLVFLESSMGLQRVPDKWVGDQRHRCWQGVQSASV